MSNRIFKNCFIYKNRECLQNLMTFNLKNERLALLSTNSEQPVNESNDANKPKNFNKNILEANELKAKKMTELSELRQRSTHLNWFYDPAIDKAAHQPLIKLNPMTMMYSGVSNDDSHLINSSSYLRKELPIRLAHLIKEFRNLPFIVACSPQILEIHERYIKAFRNFEVFQSEIKDFDGEEKFTELVRDTMSMNKDILAMLAEGFRDSRRYIKHEDEISKYLNRILIARLATRLLCEHHIELHKQAKKFEQQQQQSHDSNEALANDPSSSSSGSSNDKLSSLNRTGSDWVGIINKNFSPKKVIENSTKLVTSLCMNKYGTAPKVKIDGHIGATFPYISLPLEYILPEVLKNAFRATVEHSRLVNNPVIPDVSVTIAINEKDFVIRIRDRGGGIPHDFVSRIFDYHFSTSKENSQELNENEDNDGFNVICNTNHGLSVMHGYGFGLPTSKAYAEYLGGSITFQTLQGIGTDFYLRFALFENAYGIVRI
jgi:[3-methyl-2-oxobutanoate dehydrogenase (acetyl-transferring)] kinase